jgi:biofilm PGA synthesis N-glycosyltransferase PgaC
LPIWLNYMVSLAWAYTMGVATVLWIIASFRPDVPVGIGFGLLPGWWGTLLAVTYLLQAGTSLLVDARFEKGLASSMFWIVWYPLAFWMLQTLTAIVALPRALLRPRHARGRWISPDRGFR